jgi:hypothetical protein
MAETKNDATAGHGMARRGLEWPGEARQGLLFVSGTSVG